MPFSNKVYAGISHIYSIYKILFRLRLEYVRSDMHEIVSPIRIRRDLLDQGILHCRHFPKKKAQKS